MDNIIKKKISSAWSTKHSQPRRRWWQSPKIIRHINKIICSKDISGWNAGPLLLLKHYFQKTNFHDAISIGAGNCSKEISLVEKDIVDHFDIYELSLDRIYEAKKNVEEKGLSDKFNFYCEDYFSLRASKKYDFFFWDNSLHHMLDSSYAVRQSYLALNTGGCFFCHDFVGKTRFQWSELELAIVNGIRNTLDDSVFQNGDRPFNRNCVRPSLKRMIEDDPSEAADSEQIIPSVQKNFLNPLIIHTGGLIYHICLNNILQNIDEENDLLDQLLNIDLETIKHGFHHYAFILCKK